MSAATICAPAAVERSSRSVMASKVRAVLFDWGRTLYDTEANNLFSGVSEMLRELSKRFDLVLVSLAKNDSPEERRKKIEASGIAGYFKFVFIGGEDKDAMYEEALLKLNLQAAEVIIVDDRMIRGIAWGNRVGATTVWFRNGKFSDEVSTKETGNPTFVVGTITELKHALMQVDSGL
jgi:FMN phosphatase YigB (HAD superfamily)